MMKTNENDVLDTLNRNAKEEVAQQIVEIPSGLCDASGRPVTWRMTVGQANALAARLRDLRERGLLG